MPGTHARGLHSFDPGSSSGTSATLVLNNVNAEDDGEEDRAGPPVDTTMANVPAAFTSTISSVFSPALAGDTVSFKSTDESNVMPPPFSSSISPTSHPDHVSQPPRRHASGVHSALSSSQTTSSDARTTSSNRKRKHDATGDMPPSSSKRASRNRTETINPVIISSQLNSTLTRLADVMEKSLVVTANSIEVPTTHAAPLPSSSSSSVIPSQLQVSGPPSTSSSLSDLEVLDKAFGIVVADKEFLSEDELLGASVLFSSTSNGAVRIARNFIALSNNPTVQHRFLVHQLNQAGHHTGKGKDKATRDDDDFQMIS